MNGRVWLIGETSNSAKIAKQLVHSNLLRLHPKVIQWAKTQANKRDVGYQTVINETLLNFTD